MSTGKKLYSGSTDNIYTEVAELKRKSAMKVKRYGDTMTGPLSISNNNAHALSVSNSTDLTEILDVDTNLKRVYVNGVDIGSAINTNTTDITNKVSKTGDTMSGSLIISADLSHGLKVTNAANNFTILDVNTLTDTVAVNNNLTVNGTDFTTALNSKVNTTTYTAGLATKVDQSAYDTEVSTLNSNIAGKVSKSGDTINGTLNIAADNLHSLKVTNSTGTTTVLDIDTTGSKATIPALTISGFSSAGLVHNNSTGVLSTSLLTTTDLGSISIPDSNLATIATAGKVSNSATTATPLNTNSTIVSRDGSGNFSASNITANLTGNVIGNVTGSASLNVLQTAYDSKMSTLDSEIATNTSNIASNTTAIATKVSQSVYDSKMTTLDSEIATNTSNIATNTTNIASNTSTIAGKVSQSAYDSKMTTLDSEIATNTSNIATNTTNITGKVSKSGDTMTGSLAIPYIASASSLQIGSSSDAYGFSGINLATPASSSVWPFVIGNRDGGIGGSNGTGTIFRSLYVNAFGKVGTRSNILDAGDGTAYAEFAGILGASAGKVQLKWDSTNGVQIYDATNSQDWLYQGSTTTGSVHSKNNTLDDGSGKMLLYSATTGHPSLLSLKSDVTSYGSSLNGPRIEFNTNYTSLSATYFQAAIQGIDENILSQGSGSGGLSFRVYNNASEVEALRLSSNQQVKTLYNILEDGLGNMMLSSSSSNTGLFLGGINNSASTFALVNENTHDNIQIMFDMYYDGTNLKSTSSNSSFRLEKSGNSVGLEYGVATAGSNLTMHTGFSLDNTGVLSSKNNMLDNGFGKIILPNTGTYSMKDGSGNSNDIIALDSGGTLYFSSPSSAGVVTGDMFIGVRTGRTLFLQNGGNDTSIGGNVTIAGILAINSPSFTTNTSYSNDMIYLRTCASQASNPGKERWSMGMFNQETGSSNTGSDFALWAYGDAGSSAFINNAFTIKRSDLTSAFNAAMTINGNTTINKSSSNALKVWDGTNTAFNVNTSTNAISTKNNIIDGGNGDITITGTATSNGATFLLGPSQNYIYVVEKYGAKVNGIVRQSASITSGSNILTCSSATFTSADVGKQISVSGAGASGVVLCTTISGFTNSTTITLTANASTTVTTAAQIVYGTDDTTAWRNAIAAINTQLGGTIYCSKAGISLLNSSTQGAPLGGNPGLLNLPYLPLNTQTQFITFGIVGPEAPAWSAGSEFTNCPVTTGTLILYANGSGAQAISTGTATANVINAGTSSGNYSNICFYMKNVTIRVPPSSGYNAMNLLWVEQVILENVVCDVGCISMKDTAQPLGGNFGIATPANGNGAKILLKNCGVLGYATGFILNEHTEADALFAWLNSVGYQIWDADHGMNLGRIQSIWNTTSIQATNTFSRGGVQIKIAQLDIEDATATVSAPTWTYTGLVHISDASNILYGKIDVVRVVAGVGKSFNALTVTGATNCSISVIGGDQKSSQTLTINTSNASALKVTDGTTDALNVNTSTSTLTVNNLTVTGTSNLSAISVPSITLTGGSYSPGSATALNYYEEYDHVNVRITDGTNYSGYITINYVRIGKMVFVGIPSWAMTTVSDITNWVWCDTVSPTRFAPSHDTNPQVINGVDHDSTQVNNWEVQMISGRIHIGPSPQSGSSRFGTGSIGGGNYVTFNYML